MKRILALIVVAVLLVSSAVTVSAAEPKYKGRTDFMWGVTSHDYLYQTYGQDPELYIKTTAETGADLFRIGFNQQLDIYGLEYLDKCVKLCDEYGLKIHVLMRFVTYDESMLELNTNYFEMIATRYNGKNGHGFIDSYEVGAEEDNRMLQNKYPTNGPNGDMFEHYYESDLIKWQKLYASCIEGIRKASTSKISIDFSHLHYAPLLYMYQHGLDFDIIGLDWYTNMGPLDKVLNPVLEKFPHDIYITETNLWAGPETNQDNLDEYNRLFEFMDLAYKTPRVKSLMVYELMDEPEYDNWGDTFTTQEAHFGLCDANPDGTIKRFKPIFYKIQELWGGGPVKKVPVTYEQPKEEKPVESDTVVSSTTSESKPDSSIVQNDNNSSVPETDTTVSAPVIEPIKDTVVKQMVTTNTTKKFPWLWFITGSAVIILLGASALVIFVIKPKFIRNLSHK